MSLPRSEGHVFYRKLNKLLGDAGFDEFVEELCKPLYHVRMGRPGIAPGVYFRMLMVGYFEGIGSQRGIAWRCADSLSLREFLGVSVAEPTPDHSSLTRIRDRLSLEIHVEVFRFVLRIADEKGLVKGKTVAVDATTLEANAAMKSIVRRDTGEDWQAYLKRLMSESGETGEDDDPSAEDTARFDRKRKGKKVPNTEWTSGSDPDSRITKMKDGRTHLAYKAEHAIDLETEVVLAAEIYLANESDVETIGPSVRRAQDHLLAVESEAEIAEVVGDKGYCSNATLAELEFTDYFRTYIVEPKYRGRRNWKNKPDEQRRAVRNNRRRTRGVRGRALQRLRSERAERSFAHVCETGGARRTWLRGLEKVQKRYVVSGAVRNLGLLMRSLCGIGTARSLQAPGALARAVYLALYVTDRACEALIVRRRSFQPSVNENSLLGQTLAEAA